MGGYEARVGWGGEVNLAWEPGLTRTSQKLLPSAWCWQHSRAWGVVPAQTQHKQHLPRVHRHPTGKSLGDWNFLKIWKKGIAQYYLFGVLLGTYDLKQNEGENSPSLHVSFIMWAKEAGPCGCNPWPFPLWSPGMLQSAQRSKKETKACVKKGWNGKIQ